jgi:hypothetical protein
MKNLQLVAAALSLAYATLETLNSKHGKGSITGLTVDIGSTDLNSGVIKGSIARSTGDSRTFSLKVKPNGKVEVRTQDHKATITG